MLPGTGRETGRLAVHVRCPGACHDRSRQLLPPRPFRCPQRSAERAHEAPRPPGYHHDRAVCRARRRRLGGRAGAVRSRRAGLAAHVPRPAPWHPLPRPLRPRLRSTRPPPIRAVLSRPGPDAGAAPRRRGGRERWPDAAPRPRPGGGAGGADPPGSAPGPSPAARCWANSPSRRVPMRSRPARRCWRAGRWTAASSRLPRSAVKRQSPRRSAIMAPPR